MKNITNTQFKRNLIFTRSLNIFIDENNIKIINIVKYESILANTIDPPYIYIAIPPKIPLSTIK